MARKYARKGKYRNGQGNQKFEGGDGYGNDSQASSINYRERENRRDYSHGQARGRDRGRARHSCSRSQSPSPHPHHQQRNQPQHQHTSKSQSRNQAWLRTNELNPNNQQGDITMTNTEIDFDSPFLLQPQENSSDLIKLITSLVAEVDSLKRQVLGSFFASAANVTTEMEMEMNIEDEAADAMLLDC